MINRYDAEGAQSSFQPGSNEQVLTNKLGIIESEDMDDAELVLLEKLYQSVLIEHLPDRSLTVQDLKDWHRHWLGNIYPWAGDVRAVNLPLDYSSWERNKEAYFAAINQGLNCNYEPMEYWVRQALWT